MPRRIIVLPEEDNAIDFVEVPASNEHELQEVLLRNPQLLPAKDLGFGDDLLVVGRETLLASGSVDLLCLSSAGELVIIEFKTGPQNPDFRHALAQVLDYGADLFRLKDWTEFDQGVVQRYLNGSHVEAAFRTSRDLKDMARQAWAHDSAEWEALLARLNSVLETGDFVFVVAAQRFTSAMRQTVDYLNSSTNVGRFFLVEVVRLDAAAHKAYAAQVVHQPPARSAAGGGARAQASENEFLSRIDDVLYRQAMNELFSNVRTLGLALAWGSKGASIRLGSPDREEPLSIGWVFIEGDQWTWAKHVTFGVDPNTLQGHPTIAAVVDAFCVEVKAVAGAKQAGGKSNAAIFEPAAFVQAHPQLIQLLDRLTKNVTRLREG